MGWLAAMMRRLPGGDRDQNEQAAFARREAELQRRFERLTQEVDVVQRAQGNVEPNR